MKSFKFFIHGTEFNVEVTDIEDNIANIEVNGTKYKVEVNREITIQKTPTLIRNPIINNGGASIKKQEDLVLKVKAPLPGNIISITVKEGDRITKDQTLVVMEAMKMENKINAEKDGIIKSIKISVGDAVLQEDLLIEIEY